MNYNLDSYDWVDNHHSPKILKKLKFIINKKKNKKFYHLDIGCGNGFITNQISYFFKKSLGIEPSTSGIKLAKKYKSSKLKFQKITLENLAKKNVKFDYITIIEVIEHQYDPFNFMKNIEKISKKNGYVLISTPFHGFFKNLAIALLNKFDDHFTVMWKHGHIKFFSEKTFKELIANYKFNIENIFYSGRFYPFSNSMIFLLKKN